MVAKSRTENVERATIRQLAQVHRDVISRLASEVAKHQNLDGEPDRVQTMEGLIAIVGPSLKTSEGAMAKIGDERWGKLAELAEHVGELALARFDSAFQKIKDQNDPIETIGRVGMFFDLMEKSRAFTREQKDLLEATVGWPALDQIKDTLNAKLAKIKGNGLRT